MDAYDEANGLVKHLAQFSRTQPLQPRPTPINQLICKALSLVEPLVRTKGIKVTENLNPNLPDVDADPVQMEQVILNRKRPVWTVRRGEGSQVSIKSVKWTLEVKRDSAEVWRDSRGAIPGFD